MLLDRRSRRWSAARPSLIQASIGSTAAAVAGGIAGLSTIGQNLNSHPSSGPGTQRPHGSGIVDGRVAMTAPREIPIFRNYPRTGRGAGSRSITVINEAEASV